jgi:hypothetical protein
VTAGNRIGGSTRRIPTASRRMVPIFMNVER